MPAATLRMIAPLNPSACSTMAKALRRSLCFPMMLATLRRSSPSGGDVAAPVMMMQAMSPRALVAKRSKCVTILLMLSLVAAPSVYKMYKFPDTH